MTNEAFFKIVKDVLKDFSERYFVCLAFGWTGRFVQNLPVIW